MPYSRATASVEAGRRLQTARISTPGRARSPGMWRGRGVAPAPRPPAPRGGGGVGGPRPGGGVLARAPIRPTRRVGCVMRVLGREGRLLASLSDDLDGGRPGD